MVAPISLIVPAYGPVGNPYSAHVDKWWAAVMRMDPAPAEVIVAHTDPEPLGLLAKAPPTIPTRGVVVATDAPMKDCGNVGIAAASSRWASITGVDDEYRPHALADLQAADDAGADILLWHHEDFSDTVQRHHWDPISLRTNNTVHGSCAFRVDMWQRVGGFPAVGWSDWAFWLLCVKAEARVYRSDQIGVLWDPGRSRDTWTNQACGNGDILAARNAEIHALVRELWP